MATRAEQEAHEAHIREQQAGRLVGKRRQKWLRFGVLHHFRRYTVTQDGVTGLLESSPSSSSSSAGARSGPAGLWRDDLVSACISCGHVSLLEAMPTEQRGGKRWPESLFVTRSILLAAALEHDAMLRCVFQRYGWASNAAAALADPSPGCLTPEKLETLHAQVDKRWDQYVNSHPLVGAVVGTDPAPRWRCFPEIDYVSVGRMSDIQRACLLGDVDFVRALLQSDPTALENPHLFLTCLLLAVVRGNPACVTFLVEHCASMPRPVRCEDLINATTALETLAHKQHPVDLLGLAAAFGHVKVVELLLAHGANVNGVIGDCLGQLPPLLAAAAISPRPVRSSGRLLQTVDILLRHGASLVDGYDATPSLITPLAAACRAGDENLALMLLRRTRTRRMRRKVCREVFPQRNCTVLQFAAAQGLRQAVSAIVELEIDEDDTEIQPDGGAAAGAGGGGGAETKLQPEVKEAEEENTEEEEEEDEQTRMQYLATECSGQESFSATRPYVLTDSRFTALSFAVSRGHVDVAEYLIDKGASPTQSTLTVAVNQSAAECVQLLLRHGVSVSVENFRSICGWLQHERALHAVRDLVNNHQDEPDLFQQNAEVIPGSLDRMPLEFGLREACLVGNRELVQYLLDHVADPARCSRENRMAVLQKQESSILARCIRLGHSSVVRLLLQHFDDAEVSVSPNVVMHTVDVARSSTPFCSLTMSLFGAACNSGSPGMVRACLSSPCIDCAPTASHNEDAVALAAGYVTVGAYRRGGAEEDGMAVLRLLEQNGYSLVHRKGLVCAAGLGHMEILRVLLDAGNPVDEVAEHNSPLTAAVRSNAPPHVVQEMIQMLVDAGADIEAIAGQQSPLMHALNSGSVVAMKMLLELGCKPNAVDTNHHDHIAPMLRSPGHLSVLRMLLEAGVYPAPDSMANSRVCNEARILVAEFCGEKLARLDLVRQGPIRLRSPAPSSIPSSAAAASSSGGESSCCVS